MYVLFYKTAPKYGFNPLLTDNFLEFFKASIQCTFFLVSNFQIGMCLILETNCIKFTENSFFWNRKFKRKKAEIPGRIQCLLRWELRFHQIVRPREISTICSCFFSRRLMQNDLKLETNIAYAKLRKSQKIKKPEIIIRNPEVEIL